MSPAPAARHQVVVGNLYYTLRTARPAGCQVMLSPLDWRVSRVEQWQPDLLVTTPADIGVLRLEVPPLLAVEVLSPSTALVDLNLKRAAYEAAGVPSYWIVDPAGPALSVLRLVGGAYEVVHERATGRLELCEPFPVVLDVDRLAEP